MGSLDFLLISFTVKILIVLSRFAYTTCCWFSQLSPFTNMVLRDVSVWCVSVSFCASHHRDAVYTAFHFAPNLPRQTRQTISYSTYLESVPQGQRPWQEQGSIEGALQSEKDEKINEQGVEKVNDYCQPIMLEH